MNKKNQLFAFFTAMFLLSGVAWASNKYGYSFVGGPYPQFSTSAIVSTDTQIKASPGYAKYLSCIGDDAAAQAGTITLYDNTAESGTQVVAWVVQALAYSTPVIFPIERRMDIGIYLGFTADLDVNCYVTFD